MNSLQEERDQVVSTGECTALLDICGPDIYSRNAFRLLGVDVDAGSRKIKRNETEFQSALEMGELAEEYCGFLRPDPLPSREELLQAGRALADTRQRFVHEFFWFWPLKWGESHSDEALQRIKAGAVNEAKEQWEAVAAIGGEASWAAKHNLAVLGHWKALDQEREVLASPTPRELTAQTRRQFDSRWDFAFKYWESLCANEEFWFLQTERILALNDPRLTTGFLRCFSQGLPIAFDNINADLAVAYCDRQMYDRARDHIKIMKATNAGNDDVDASLRRVAKPLNGRIDHAVETATFQLHNNKTEGKQRCVELFNTVGHILNVLEVLLGGESQEFTETCDRVAESMLQCQVAYGNETQDWASSLLLLESAFQIARGSRMRARIEENIHIVRQNRQADLCWFCGSCSKEDEHAVQVTLKRSVTWADIKRNPEQYRDALLQIVRQLMSQLPQIGAGGINLEGAQFFAALMAAAQRGDLCAIVCALDSRMNDAVEVMSQQGTVLVPRCHTCAAVHSGQTLDPVDALEKKVKAANATVEQAASTRESLGKRIACNAQAREKARFARKWLLSSRLKSLHKKQAEWTQRYDNARNARDRLQSRLEERKRIGTVKGLDHLQSWPAVVKAKQDGFHVA
jgi:hypothetical protein